MNSIPAQEIERRGMAVVDEALREGPVHITKDDQPAYVVLTEDAFAALELAQQEAAPERLQAALADLAAGRTHRYEDADALLLALDAADQHT